MMEKHTSKLLSILSITLMLSVCFIGALEYSDSSDAKTYSKYDSGGNEYVFIDGVLHIRKTEGCSGTMPDFATYENIAQLVGTSKTITSVVIEEGITNISRMAFALCTTLTSIVIPNTVTDIGVNAFSGCSSLNAVVIPDSVTHIGSGAFNECRSLTSITIPDSVTSIDDSGLYSGGGQFANCSSLSSVTLGNGIDRVTSNMFYKCTSLTSIVIPDNITRIGTYAFQECNLTEVIIPDSVISLGDDTFYYNESLTSITFGSGITKIPNNLFAGCTALTSITMRGENPPTLSVSSNIPSSVTIHVPYGSGDNYKASWSSYANQIVEDEPKTVTVSFDSNGGSSVSEQSFISGQKATEIVPYRNGYTFVGWYSDSNLTNRFNFDSVVRTDMTLYAKWTEDIVFSSVAPTTTIIGNIYQYIPTANITGFDVAIRNAPSWLTVIENRVLGTAPTSAENQNVTFIVELTKSGYTSATQEVTVHVYPIIEIVNPTVYIIAHEV